jgi:biopolymer transport protein ExbD
MIFTSNNAMNELANVYSRCIVLTEAISVQQLMQSRSISEPVARAIIQMDQTPSKSDALQLAKFFNEINAEQNDALQQLQHYYGEFVALRLRNRINPQITAFATFHQFENEVDARQEAKKSVANDDAFEQVDAVYEDEYIAIYEAKTPAEACELGKDYTFCISRRGSSNMFYNYKGSINKHTKPGDVAIGTWFIRLKKRHNGDIVSDAKQGDAWEQPEHLIVIHIDKDGKLKWTWADNGRQGHGTESVTQQQVLQQFPEFAPVFNGGGDFKGIAVSSFSEREIFVYNTLNDLQQSAEAFNAATKEQKELYIKMKGDIPFDVDTYAHLNGALRNELFKRIKVVKPALWSIMQPVDRLKLAKITALPHLHLRSDSDNSNLILSLLLYDTQ